MDNNQLNNGNNMTPAPEQSVETPPVMSPVPEQNTESTHVEPPVETPAPVAPSQPQLSQPIQQPVIPPVQESIETPTTATQNQEQNGNIPPVTPTTPTQVTETSPSNPQNNVTTQTNPINVDNIIQKISKNKKTIMIGVGVLIALILIIVLFGGNSSGHKNTTGLSSYSGKDVNLNCEHEEKNENGTMKMYSDVLFNHNNYKLTVYTKLVVTHNKELTDERYKEFIDSLNSMECIYDKDCSGSHLELGITSLGWDTIVDRKGNTLTITYYNISGMHSKITESEKKETISSLESQGFKCK